MFESPQNSFLLEFLLENNRIKKCRKASFRKKILTKVNPTCLQQNKLRRTIKDIIPKEMKVIEDNHFGVDFEYKGLKIDQKFSFGALGENVVKIRVKERRLLNNSNWTMIINKKPEIELFQTTNLSNFVKKNWGIVQKRLVSKKELYSEYAVHLEELYALETITPIRTEINQNSLYETLNFIKNLPQEITLTQNASIQTKN